MIRITETPALFFYVVSPPHKPSTMARSVYPRTIVEKTPNHRPGMASYTAWTLNDFKADGSTPPSADNRPRFSIQIYDTMPAAASDAHIKWLCEYIHECTRRLERQVARHGLGSCRRHWILY